VLKGDYSPKRGSEPSASLFCHLGSGNVFVMSVSRSPGRYNLHRLGWSAFEDLCMQIMRVVLGETSTRFRPGRDGGRDGWFVGQASNLLVAQNQLAGNFIVQCKHTSLSHNPLDETDLKGEIEKVQKAAAKGSLHYILMTNRQVTAQSEAAIRKAFESIKGVERCIVLSESWIEDTVDAHPRLLRLVPRLYGIGDLSQILSFVIELQTTALLEDLANSLRTFVPTESYRRAENTLNTHRFVVLVGPPASGKSAIAANLCMVSIAQEADTRILRIERAEQFDTTWSPGDTHTIYWVDDVFGETTLDEDRLKEWSAALEKVEAARKRGSRVIFCTRDYILSAAEQRLKRNKADLINDARVRINVTDLSDVERDAILYNHIKDGDIGQPQKAQLKKHLSHVARLPSFSPELARRLGNKRFNQLFMPSEHDLEKFFKYPIRHFRDIIHGLAGSETAALAVCLLSNNSVPDPIPDDALVDAVLRTYGVAMKDVRGAFEMLEGSLVKRVRSDTKQTWQLHHPSMIEALQEELSAKSSQLVLYLQSARIAAVLRDTTTLPTEEDSRLVFLPEAVYSYLMDRFEVERESERQGIAQYLVKRSSDRFLIELDARYPHVIDRALAIASDPDGDDASPSLAVRLHRVESAVLLSDARRAIVADALSESVKENGGSGFLALAGFEAAVPGFIGEFLRAEVEKKFSSIDSVYDWVGQDLSSTDHVEGAREALNSHVGRLQSALSSAGLLSDGVNAVLTVEKDRYLERLRERETEIQEREEERADAMQDQWKEQRHEERYELENGRFADVDE
jgi:hypothetical protein